MPPAVATVSPAVVTVPPPWNNRAADCQITSRPDRPLPLSDLEDGELIFALRALYLLARDNAQTDYIFMDPWYTRPADRQSKSQSERPLDKHPSRI